MVLECPVEQLLVLIGTIPGYRADITAYTSMALCYRHQTKFIDSGFIDKLLYGPQALSILRKNV